MTKQTKKKVMKQGEPILTCHDEDCPKCGFPETIDVRNSETMKIMRRICSKRCGWFITGKDLDKLNQSLKK